MTRQLLGLYLTFFWALVAQGAELSPQKIQERLKYYQNLLSFKTRFQQVKRFKELNLELKSEGELTVRRPHLIVWQVMKPSPLTVTLNGKEIRLVQESESGAKEQRWSLDSGAKSRDAKGLGQLMAWLQLDATIISQNYRLNEEQPGELVCVPKKEDREDPFLSFRLKLAADGSLRTLVMQERSGDSLEITFSAPKRIP